MIRLLQDGILWFLRSRVLTASFTRLIAFAQQFSFKGEFYYAVPVCPAFNIISY